MSDIYAQLKRIIAEHERAERRTLDIRKLYQQMEQIVFIIDNSKASYPDQIKEIREIAAEAAGVQ